MDRAEQRAKIRALLDALEEGERSGDPQPHEEVFSRIHLEGLGPIATQWSKFESHIVHREAPELLRREMHRAFYAGAAAMLPIFAGMKGLDDAVFQQLSDEIMEWARSLHRGKA